MGIGWTSDDPILLRSYIARYRVVFRVRLISVTALAVAVAVSFSPATAIAFAAVQYLLFGLFIGSVEHANRRWDHPATPRRLRLQGLLLGFLIACHGNWLALYVNAAEPSLHVESVLLVITLFVLAGLQVHLSVASLLLNVAPSFITLFLITRPEQAGDLAPHLWAGGLFCFAILAASWRQQSTDHQSGLAAATLARRNEELQAALAVAEAASRAKTEFLAVTSHEVRTPLNAVLTMAGVLAREVRNPRHAHLARTIETAGGMLLQLLNGILDFTRAEAGKATLNLTAFDINGLVARLEAVWRPRCEEAGLSLRCEVAAAGHGWVQADAGRIEQTLVNLISNAEKFSPPGAEILLRCQASPAAPGRVRLRFEVLDRGPGVAPEDHARIFEAFEQAESGRDKGGAGLGLAICRSNIGLMGGAFGRDDRPGGGSAFWLEFETDGADAAGQATDDGPPGLVVTRRLRVLGADDHPTNREVLKLLLGPFDVELDLVEDGAAAAAAAAGGAYDLILMDAKMPVMDGVEATRRIRAAESSGARRTAIIMVTANVFPEDVERYLVAGADEVLGKPIDVRQLLETIGRFAAEPPALEAPLRAPASGAA